MRYGLCFTDIDKDFHFLLVFFKTSSQKFYFIAKYFKFFQIPNGTVLDIFHMTFIIMITFLGHRS